MEPSRGYPLVNYVLQQTLRCLCTETDWIYAVFWRILPRNYPPPKWDTEGSVLDNSKANKRNWILVWEDGFCDFAACVRSASKSNISTPHTSSADQPSLEDTAQYMQPELFFKMSHEVYSYGEGLIGKVAADNSHKWVYREPTEVDPQYLAWQGTLDSHPRVWEAQFKSGIETIAIVAVKDGLIQLGSVRKTMEDLNFVLYLQRKFNYLQSIPGVYALHPAELQLHLAAGGGEGPGGDRTKGPASLTIMNCSPESPYNDTQCWSTVERQPVVGMKRQLAEAEGIQTAPPGAMLDSLDWRPSSKTFKSVTGSSGIVPLHLYSEPVHVVHGKSFCAPAPSNQTHAMSSLRNLLSRLPVVAPPSSPAAAVASYNVPQHTLQHPQAFFDTPTAALVTADLYSASHAKRGPEHPLPVPHPKYPLKLHELPNGRSSRNVAQSGQLPPQSFPAGTEWYAEATANQELDVPSEKHDAFQNQVSS